MIEKMVVIVNCLQLMVRASFLRKESFQVSFHNLSEIEVKLLIHIDLFFRFVSTIVSEST